MLGDGQVFEPRLARGLRHLLQGMVAVAGAGVAVQVALEVG